jgi:hypothetical protein
VPKPSRRWPYNIDRARGGAMYLLKSLHPGGYDRSLQRFSQRLERKYQRHVIVKLDMENVLSRIEVRWEKEDPSLYSDGASCCAAEKSSSCAAENPSSSAARNSFPRRGSIPRLMLHDR